MKSLQAVNEHVADDIAEVEADIAKALRDLAAARDLRDTLLNLQRAAGPSSEPRALPSITPSSQESDNGNHRS